MGGKYYNEGWFGKRLALYETASRLLEPMRSRAVDLLGAMRLKVLDLATGTGALALSLARAGHEVVGIDLDLTMVKRALRKLSPELSLRFLHGDATALPFGSGSFDAATMSFALHDVPHAVALGILAEARRVLRPGGPLVILDYRDVNGRLAPRILRQVALLYESPNYRAFVRRHTAGTLESAGFRVTGRSTLLGAIQLIVGRSAPVSPPPQRSGWARGQSSK